MNSSISTIPLMNLSLAFIPAIVVITIMFRWGLDFKSSLYALARMLLQLFLVGYCLSYIFEARSSWIVVMVLAVMVSFSSWIALRTVKPRRKILLKKAFLAIITGGGITLFLVTRVVLRLDPWYLPRYMVPLAGMIFANSMNGISLAAERLEAELGQNKPYTKARNIAFGASIIPIMNSLFAVGLVSIPGMMSGQILSGISPFIAARYQIMVMCMIFGSVGMSSACFLKWAQAEFTSL